MSHQNCENYISQKEQGLHFKLIKTIINFSVSVLTFIITYYICTYEYLHQCVNICNFAGFWSDFHEIFTNKW